MLNPFPIQWLAVFAYFILRLFVGSILVFLGFSHLKNKRSLQDTLSFPWFPYNKFSVFILFSTEIIIGSMFITGFYTQYAALIGMILAIKMFIFNERFNSSQLPSRFFYALLFGVCFSLFITGAGAFAFDLPI